VGITERKGSEMGQTFEIDEHQKGRRLDKVLKSRWPDLPLAALMRYFRKKQVRLDKRPARSDDRVEAGQVVFVPWDDPATEPSHAVSTTEGVRPTIELVYAGSEICIVNKPWNLLTQPAGKGDDSVVGRVASTLGWKEKNFYPTAAHRLDRNTSGVLLVALSGPSLRALHKMWRENELRKSYLAIVKGVPEKEGLIKSQLEKDTSRNVVSTVREGGKYSETRYYRIETDGHVSLILVELVTGRPHQARVHLAEAGHPLVGDVKYGDPRLNAEWKKVGVTRPLLHARRILFPGNVPAPLEYLGGKSFVATPPGDFMAVLRDKGWNLYRDGV
jgi:RluA family pseudouridine synthase